MPRNRPLKRGAHITTQFQKIAPHPAPPMLYLENPVCAVPETKMISVRPSSQRLFQVCSLQCRQIPKARPCLYAPNIPLPSLCGREPLYVRHQSPRAFLRLEYAFPENPVPDSRQTEASC